MAKKVIRKKRQIKARKVIQIKITTRVTPKRVVGNDYEYDEDKTVIRPMAGL